MVSVLRLADLIVVIYFFIFQKNTIFPFIFEFYRFQSLIRATNAMCACLLFDSNGLTDFKGPKYYFPGSPGPSFSGINSYPVMVHAPQVSVMHL